MKPGDLVDLKAEPGEPGTVIDVDHDQPFKDDLVTIVTVEWPGGAVGRYLLHELFAPVPAASPLLAPDPVPAVPGAGADSTTMTP